MKSFLSKLSAIAIAFALIGCNDNDDDAAVVPLVTGPQTVMSAGFEREYYIQLPDEGGAAPAAIGDGALPLVIMYHGYSGSYEAWLSDTPY